MSAKKTAKYLSGHNPGSAKGQGMKAKGNRRALPTQKKKVPPSPETQMRIINTIMGAREVNKVASIFARIEENEKTAVKLLVSTAKAYYDAGNILFAAISKTATHLTANAISKAYGFPERRIILALKIFKHFENNPDALNGLSMRDTLKLIAPPPPAGENGLNRIDLGGDAGQMKFDFGELFTVPAAANQSLQNYRTVGDLVSEIIVVRRTNDGNLTSKRFAHFGEDIPQNPLLRHAYKTMSQKTQAAIEDYLAALEQEEAQLCKK
jgi:hypothetical protein